MDSKDEDKPRQSEVPTSQTQHDGDLEALETQAAQVARATSSSTSSSTRRQKKKDGQEDIALEKICQILTESQTILKDIQKQQSVPIPSVRESFIQYISNILKTVSNEEFNTLKRRITSVVDEVTQLPVSGPLGQRAPQPGYRPPSAPPFTQTDTQLQQQQNFQPVYDQQQQQVPYSSPWRLPFSSQSSASDYTLLNIGQPQSSQLTSQQAQQQSQAPHTAVRQSPVSFDLSQQAQQQSQVPHTAVRQSPVSFDLSFNDMLNSQLNTPESSKKTD